jgi:hypothetical protein
MYEGMRIMPALARLPGGGLDITERPERRSSPRARGVTEEPFLLLGRNGKKTTTRLPVTFDLTRKT